MDQFLLDLGHNLPFCRIQSVFSHGQGFRRRARIVIRRVSVVLLLDQYFVNFPGVEQACPSLIVGPVVFGLPAASRWIVERNRSALLKRVLRSEEERLQSDGSP